MLPVPREQAVPFDGGLADCQIEIGFWFISTMTLQALGRKHGPHIPFKVKRNLLMESASDPARTT
ncbi:MAG: hypothetical protein R3C11_16275 [Planctomycetaceae bacterium]